MRNITKEELNILKSNNCHSGNWSSVKVSDDFKPENIVNSHIENVSLGKNVKIIGAYITNDNFTAIPVKISAGNEAGYRDIEVWENMDIKDILDGTVREDNNSYNFEIGDNTEIIGSSILKNISIGNNCKIEGSVYISNSLIKDEVYIGPNTVIKNSLIKTKSKIDTGAVVENSVLNDNSGAGHSAKIKKSFIDTKTVIEQAEVTASVIGKMTAVHHNSLLIGVRWADGLGNVGAGALIGSNHTGKAPDQECHLGEGIFLGIGSSVKFPSDFTEAPYTIIASDVTLLPQKFCMPFSLINKPSVQFPNISPALNEVFPAWVILKGAYIIARNEMKYKKRGLDVQLFREDLLKQCITAVKKLRTLNSKKVYTEYDLPELGKNFIRDEVFFESVDAYIFYIRLCFNILKKENRMTDELAELCSPFEVDKYNFDEIYGQYIKKIIESKNRDRLREKKIFGSSITNDADNDEVLEYVRSRYK